MIILTGGAGMIGSMIAWHLNTILDRKDIIIVDDIQHPAVQKLLKDNNVGDKEEDVERFFKFQGANNTLEFLNENPDISSFIYEKIKELF